MKIYNTKNYFVPEVYGGIDETECSTMLKKFFSKKEKIVAKQINIPEYYVFRI